MTFPFKLTSGRAPRAVVFDLDDTLIHGDCTRLWTTWLYETGTTTDPIYQAVTDRMIKDYCQGTLDPHQFLADIMPSIEHLTESDLKALIDRFIDVKIKPILFAQGLDLIAKALADQLPCVIISASASFLVKPIAHFVGIDEAIGVDLVMANGIPTGTIVGTPSFREGKITRLLSWLDAKNRTSDERFMPPMVPKDIFFLTDSHNDLPLASYAGGCAVVNPDAQLAHEAEQRGWPMLTWLHP